MAILNGGFPGGGGATEEVYSTEEARIGTWVDGKPIYRKTFLATSGSSVSVWSLVPNSFIPNIDRVVNVVSTFFDENGVCANMPYLTPSRYAITAYFTNAHEGISAGVNIFVTHSVLCNRPVSVSIEYTKTTDTTPTSTLFASPSTARAPSILPTKAVTATEAEI